MFGVLRQIVLTSRPVAWVINFLVFTIGVVISNQPLTSTLLLQYLLLCIVVNFGANALNDIVDYDSDIQNPRKSGGIFTSYLPKKYHALFRQLAWISFALTILGGFITQSPLFIISVIITVLFTIAYSLPPFHFKNRPPLDVITIVICYTLLVIAGLTVNSESASIFTPTIFAHLGTFISIFISISIISHNGDHESDKRAGDATISTILGIRNTALLSIPFTLGIGIFELYNWGISPRWTVLLLSSLLIILLQIWTTLSPTQARATRSYYLSVFSVIGMTVIILTLTFLGIA